MHAQAAYVPSLLRNPPPEYSYGPQVLLCEQTDFLLFLKASSPKPEIKRRSQFRVAQGDLTVLYHRHEIVERWRRV